MRWNEANIHETGAYFVAEPEVLASLPSLTSRLTQL